MELVPITKEIIETICFIDRCLYPEDIEKYTKQFHIEHYPHMKRNELQDIAKLVSKEYTKFGTLTRWYQEYIQYEEHKKLILFIIQKELSKYDLKGE